MKIRKTRKIPGPVRALHESVLQGQALADQTAAPSEAELKAKEEEGAVCIQRPTSISAELPAATSSDPLEADDPTDTALQKRESFANAETDNTETKQRSHRALSGEKVAAALEAAGRKGALPNENADRKATQVLYTSVEFHPIWQCLANFPDLFKAQKPQKLRHMLSQYGALGRLYLAPEDPSVRKRRKKLKGNTGKNFNEGWVEFLDKKVAKRVAAVLNGSPMGGKRRSAFQYDIWCLKYLPKFKWDFLTEEIAYQRAIREQKMAAEISAAKKERDFYLSRVDRAKAQDARLARQTKREAEETEAGGAAANLSVTTAGPRVVRAYSQKRAKADPTDDPSAPVISSEVLLMLAGRR